MLILLGATLDFSAKNQQKQFFFHILNALIYSVLRLSEC